jgi:hypothetical protein
MIVHTALEYKNFLIASVLNKKEAESLTEIEVDVYFCLREVTNTPLRIFFGEAYCEYPRLMGRLAADRDDQFDKLWGCPLVVKFPFDTDDIEKYLEDLSKGFIKDLPHEVEDD